MQEDEDPTVMMGNGRVKLKLLQVAWGVRGVSVESQMQWPSILRVGPMVLEDRSRRRGNKMSERFPGS